MPHIMKTETELERLRANLQDAHNELIITERETDNQLVYDYVHEALSIANKVKSSSVIISESKANDACPKCGSEQIRELDHIDMIGCNNSHAQWADERELINL